MIAAVAAIDRRAKPVTLKRRAAGTFNADGEAVLGVETSNTIQAVVQPASGRSLEDMPEGVRQEARYLAWSRSEIRNDDQIIHAGLTYRVVYVWPRLEGGFYRAAMGLLA
jgi:hypothetical protein